MSEQEVTVSGRCAKCGAIDCRPDLSSCWCCGAEGEAFRPFKECSCDIDAHDPKCPAHGTVTPNRQDKSTK